MALINCPECGKEVSNQAQVCIHCGYPLMKNSAQRSASVVNVQAASANTERRPVPPVKENNGVPNDFRTPYEKRVSGRKKALIAGAVVGFFWFLLTGEAGLRVLEPALPLVLVCGILWFLSRIFKEDFWGTRILTYPFWFVLTMIPGSLIGGLIHVAVKTAIQSGIMGK